MSPTAWYGFLIIMIAFAGFGLLVNFVAAQVRQAARPIPVRARYRRTPPR